MSKTVRPASLKGALPMSKPVAGGPYKRILPFLCIEGVSISAVGLQLVLSNEIVKVPGTETNIADFANFVFFSSNKSIIENLNVSDAALKDKISREQQNVWHFSLKEKDFTDKAHVGTQLPLRRIKHQTHAQSFPMDLAINGTNNLYVLVASFTADSNNNIIIGNVLKETILEHGRPPLESNLYTLSAGLEGYGAKGNIWPASVHDSLVSSGQGGLVPADMAGRYHVSTPHPTLSSERVINVKSKDLRILWPAVNAHPTIVDDASPSVTNNPNVDLPRQNTLGPLADAESQIDVYTGPLGYFSPLHLSRARNGIVYGYFGFDLIDYFKDNSLFGKYIKNPTALAACVEVLDIKITRSKTKKLDIRSNKLTASGTFTGLCKLMNPGSEYPYIHVGSLNDDVQIIKKFNNGEVIGIAFRDDEAAQYESGGLEYSVQILLADKTKDAFKTISNLVARAVVSTDLDPAKSGDLVSRYMAGIKFINSAAAYGAFTGKEWQKVLLTLTSEFSPEGGNQMIGALIRGYGLALETILNSSVSATKTAAAAFDSAIYNVNIPVPLEAKAELNGGLQVSNPSNVGLNYIDDYLSNTGGVIPAITYQTMQQRIMAEEEKFPAGAENAENTNSFGYVSPSSVALGANPVIDTSTQNIDMGDQEALFAANPPTTVSAVDLNPSSQANANAAVISSLGISITPLLVSLNRLVAVSELVTPQTTPSSEILGDNAEQFNNDSLSQETLGSNVSIINASAAGQGAFSAYAGALANQIIGEEFNGFNLQGPSTSTNSPGAIATADPAASNLITQSEQSPVATALTFGSLMRVEYLSSYTPQSGIGAENWSILTDIVFNQAQSSSEMLVCRLVEVQGEFDTTGNTIFNPLSTLFVIGPLRNIKIAGDFAQLLRSYMQELDPYLSQFNSLRNAYDQEVLYSQVVPMDSVILESIAQSTPPAEPTIPLPLPNQTIPYPPTPSIKPPSWET